MDAIGRYEQLALDCLNLADASRDPTVREQLVHRAEQLLMAGPSRAFGLRSITDR
jgi:hypothetical protein